MMKIRFSVSPWAVLLAGLIFYFSDENAPVPILLPVLIHEAGHLLALRIFGCRSAELRLEPGGLCIRYASDLSDRELLAAALAGPAAGLLYAGIAARCGGSGELSADVSLLLSGINLIPAPPLDGGRAIEALFGRQIALRVGALSAALVAAGGLVLLLGGKGAALLSVGLLLLLRQLADQGRSSAS